MIASLTAILICQLLGEATVRATGLPLPGPVLGMVLMLGLLALRDGLGARLPAELRGDGPERVGRFLLAHLSLLFVPAGVGVVQRLDILGAHGLALGIALVVSTVLALLATVFTFRLLARVLERGAEPGAGPQP